MGPCEKQSSEMWQNWKELKGPFWSIILNGEWQNKQNYERTEVDEFWKEKRETEWRLSILNANRKKFMHFVF